jgi:hypothetical protein
MEDKGEYQLDRTDNSSAPSATVIVPLAGPGRWIKRLPGSSGGSCPPIDLLLVVGTTTPATTSPDGSWCAPYPTLAAAFAAVAGLDRSLAVGFVLTQDFSAESPLALPTTSFRYTFQSIGNGKAPEFTLTLPEEAGTIEFIFDRVRHPTYTLPIVGGGPSTAVFFSFICDRGQAAATQQEIPGIDDSGYTGTQIFDSLVGGSCVADWNGAVATRVKAFGTVFGYTPGDFQFAMSVYSFDQIDSCRFEAAILTAAAAPAATGGIGFTSCVFAGASSFTGPAGSFVIDNLTASTYVATVGPLPSPASVQMEYAGTAVGTYASRPAAGLPGRGYRPTDGPVAALDNGTRWMPDIAGTLGTEPPDVSGYDVVGAGATIVNNTGVIEMDMTAAAGNNAYGRVTGYAPNVVRVVHVRPLSRSDNNGGAGDQCGGQAGIFIAEASPGTQLITFTYGISQSGATPFQMTQIDILDWTSGTVIATGVFEENVTPGPLGMWLRFTDDNVNHIFEMSMNGFLWQTLLSRARGAFLTPTRLGIGVCRLTGVGNMPVQAQLDSYSLTSLP